MHPHHLRLVLTLVTVASAALMVTSVFLAPRAIARLPADFLVREPPPRPLPIVVGRAILGILMVGLGVLLLFLPGPGILCIVLGLILIDGPWKRRALQRLARSPRVRAELDAVRKKRGAPPFEHP